ncbi:MAG: aconitate hydratase [Clostridiales bacterium]|nr:aconitate hydratase [Clostridiales bacterium]
MGLNVTQKLIFAHLMSGEMIKGKEIGLKIDQTLTQDATGTMAYLQFEAMGVKRVKTEKSVAYIDHNTLQTGFENADDHKYIQSCAKKYGLYFSRPGKGICHQVHLERFGIPGKTLIGSDSHTPTGGGIGMLAFGAGGLDVALAMSGQPYYITMPEIIRVNLTGKLHKFVSAKDVILELLRRLTVKGGVGKIFEYAGDGVKTLTVPERATITNMGTELGLTTSLFPSDEVTEKFLSLQKRGKDYVKIVADPDAEYDGEITINLSEIVPLAACPHSPDRVLPVSEIGKIKIDQCCIGSCTNSSYEDLMKAAMILKGKTVNDKVSLTVSPGSKQVFDLLAQNGGLSNLISAGARILECACGPCISMGQSPSSGGVSLRTFNRNFEGRSGTKDARVYLVSPETAAVSAINGYLTDPREIDWDISFEQLNEINPNDNMIIPPASADEAEKVEIIRGPNIKPFPKGHKLENEIKPRVALVAGDNITTDHIMPAGAKILPYRSNIPYLSRFCFTVCDPDFPERMKEIQSGIIVAGINYGQGSSREHAALVPLYLGVRCVAAKSFARIHKANLINNGILPLTFVNPDDYNEFSLGDPVVVENVRESVEKGKNIIIKNERTGKRIETQCVLTEREVKSILSGGLINSAGDEQ